MSAPADTAPERPFVGLRKYEERHAKLFFGRDDERQLLIGNLRTSRFTVLYAQSGAGKSSLLRAGVVPRLLELAVKAAEDDGLPAFAPVILDSWSGDPLATLVELIGASPGTSLEEAIVTAAADRRATLLVILDQFEEYFAHQRDERVRASFAEAIGRCVARSDLPVNFLVSIREDAYASVGNLFKGQVPNVYGNYLQLRPLDLKGAREAIEEPLKLFRVTADKELVDEVVGGIRDKTDAQYVAAPYLQLVMDAIWDARDGARTIGPDTLRELGGSETIIETHVGKALALPEGDQQIAAAALRYLVPSDRGKLTLTVEQLASFPPNYTAAQLRPVLEHLYRERILAAGAVEDSYELFHDVLASHVIRWRVAFEGRQLREAERRAKEERRAKQNARRLAGFLGAVVLAGLIVGALILINNERHQRETAQSERIAARALEISDLGLQSLYALESYQTSHTLDARSAILRVAASHQLGMPFAVDQGAINDVAVRPDGRTAAVARGDGWVGLWDLASRRELTSQGIPPPGLGAALKGYPVYHIIGSNIGAVAFSPDGTKLAFGRNIEYYDLPRGDFRVLATIDLWDLKRNRAIGPPLRGPADRINALAWSPRGNQLVSASSDGTARLWNLSGRRRIVKLKEAGAVNAVSFSTDGRMLATSSCDEGDRDNHADTTDHAVWLWDTRSGRLITRLPGRKPVCGIAFSPNGRLLAAGGDEQTVTLWDVHKGRPVDPPFVGHNDDINAVAFSPDGKTFASGGRDHTVRLWDISTHRQLGSPLVHTGNVSAITFVNASTLLSGGSDGVRVWSVRSPNEVAVLPTERHSGAVSVATSPNGRYVAWTDDVLVTPKHGLPYGSTVEVWDVRANHRALKISEPTATTNNLAFGRDSRTLAWSSSSGHSVLVWDIVSNRLIRRIPAPNNNITTRRIAFSPDGRTVAFDVTDGQQTTIELADAFGSGAPVSIQVPKSDGELLGLAFSPDGRELVGGGTDGTLRVFDVHARREVGAPLTGHRGGVYGVAFSPDGNTVATGGGDQTIRFWDVGARRERGAPLTQHTAAVYGVAFSPDGKLLASASLDGSVRLWDVGSERALLTFAGHTDYVYGVAFTPDGKTVVSGGGDGSVRLWSNFSLEASIRRLCTYVDKRNAAALWRQYEPSTDFSNLPC